MKKAFVDISLRLSLFYAKRPITANSIAGFVTFSGGNLVSQIITEEAPVNYNRVIETGILGVGMNSIALYGWYRFLDRVLGSGTHMKGVVLKCMADQVFYAPFSIMSFFSYAAYTENKNVRYLWTEFIEKVRTSLLTVWIADCCMWPTVNFIGFRFIPTHIRPTYVCMAQFIWQVYLSSVSFKHS